MELKPCPFCGGEAELGVIYISTGWFGGSVTCQTCFSQLCSTAGDTEEEAARNAVIAWNARVERTCKAIPNNGWEMKIDVISTHHCGSCGAFLSDEDNYCGICGAKVID